MVTTKKQQLANIFLATCTSRQVLKLIADQWTALVIYALEDGTKRFSQLLTQIDGISKKMLTQTLRDMERNGLVQRVVYPVVPPHVDYSLTPLGRTLIEPICALRKWAEEHLHEVEEARTEHDQANHIFCSRANSRIRAAEIAWVLCCADKPNSQSPSSPANGDHMAIVCWWALPLSASPVRDQ